MMQKYSWAYPAVNQIEYQVQFPVSARAGHFSAGWLPIADASRLDPHASCATLS
jgi:hypothetical protein